MEFWEIPVILGNSGDSGKCRVFWEFQGIPGTEKMEFWKFQGKFREFWENSWKKCGILKESHGNFERNPGNFGANLWGKSMEF